MHRSREMVGAANYDELGRACRSCQSANSMVLPNLTDRRGRLARASVRNQTGGRNSKQLLRRGYAVMSALALSISVQP